MRSLSPRKAALLVVALVLFAAAWIFLDVPPLAVLREWAEQTGPWFPVIFWLLYVLITQFPIPRTIMTISAGVLFGSALGVLIAITATTVAAVISLVIVRYLLRDWIAPRLTHPAVETINRRLEARGWLAVASLRMVAFVPFSVMNYASALTRVRVLPFTLATFVGSLPGTIVVVLFGDTLTGQANPVIVACTAALTVVGLLGVLLDARLPAPVSEVKPGG
ncbi:TVP38/TMEM64 family protein [Corynebacterium sp. TA-R-1]|uniref:TVP38/TMEM64 family membrane protein n=1 Tax=Corynebacterium stercoris TaxID=2943490 RepID=A0ABT1FZC3_9CORY|nr:TVP38/TMEM64 family protein [Corynebacterium stercoris]MCP1387071.1 TVP38/TMEM64 family protein [Corynebacterium stercoris]